MIRPVPRNGRRFAAFMLLLAGLVAAPSAWAAETMVEALDGQRSFDTLWPGGTFEMSQEAGLSFARVITDGQGKGTFIANVRPYKPTIDATGKFIKVWVKVDEIARLGGIEFRLSSDRFSENYFAFGLAMYDDEDFNILRDGVWTTLTFSFGSAVVHGKPDRSAINSVGWYVADKGSDLPLTAHWGGLALVDEPPSGVLSITFDDGYDEHLLAAEMMAKYDMKGTAYIIPDSIGQQGYLTSHQLVDLQETYGWDVAAHHETPFTEMKPDELETSILGVQRYLMQNHFNAGAYHLAYPLGKQNTYLVRPLVRKHFATARIAASGRETLPPADPHLLRVYNVTHRTTPEEIAEAARTAKENREWLILMMHYLVEDAQSDLQYSIADFDEMLKAISKTGITVRPLIQVWDACGHDTAPCDFSVPAAPRR